MKIKDKAKDRSDEPMTAVTGLNLDISHRTHDRGAIRMIAVRSYTYTRPMIYANPEIDREPMS
jgi:hypothetical protein